MALGSPVIAIIDDYEGLVPQLDAYKRLRHALPDADIRVITSQPLGVDDIQALADVEYLVLIRERTRITSALLDRLPALVALVQTGTAGAPETSHIDQAACQSRGIAILEGGVSDGHSAAEITWALVLNATRHVHEYIRNMEAGRWQQGRADHPSLGRALHGQTMGILGYGRIGQLLGGYARAFGMKVLVWGRENTRHAAERDGVDVASSRDDLFRESDVLALQMRLNADTLHSVGVRDLSLMKPTALLVNTARAGLIAPGALAEALQAGRPGRVAMDVYDEEPVLGQHFIHHHPGSVATPHIGYVERNSYERLFGAAFDVLLDRLGARSFVSGQ